MNVTVIMTAFFMTVGIAFILADLLKVPSFAASKAMNNLGRKRNKKTNPIDLMCAEVAGLLSSKLRLNEYRRIQLAIDLESADIPLTPEQYTANAIVKSSLVGILAIPILFFSRFLALVTVCMAVILYVIEIKRVSGKIKARRRKIEYELPRLVANIEKSLIHSRDVLGILDSYRELAGEELRRELEITTADMRSGNYEVALTRLEARVGSAMLSDVTRGLIGVIRGDDTQVYWGMLSLKFEDFQRQILKYEASKAPKRVRRLSMVLLCCFMAIYVVVIGYVLITSLGGIFG